ncbi:hypothetical protein HK100_007312 [Physocladia obscura]|uniref:Uncharacterized protein n=1 Tax=Physocladia obscura TaxID=109957 RepID=A0AAD5SPE5_9FUNG|nr:hypothetical protein HK100_007312 [Physocladia obscura]
MASTDSDNIPTYKAVATLYQKPRIDATVYVDLCEGKVTRIRDEKYAVENDKGSSGNDLRRSEGKIKVEEGS